MPFNHKLLRPKTVVAVPAGPSYDSDAATYIAAVEAADGQSLETAVADAINDFVVGCKADGIWSAIKSCLILCGARTLSGALVPLVGSAPTNNGPFVSGDYARGGATPGLKGNGSTKYIDTNRQDDADGQNDCHRACWATAIASAQYMQYFGARSAGATTMTELYHFNGGGFADFVRCRSSGGTSAGQTAAAAGFKGMSRSASASFGWRTVSLSGTHTETSVAPTSNKIQIFAIGGSTGSRSDARIAFFSSGSALTLTTLESRVSTLITAIGAAVP